MRLAPSSQQYTGITPYIWHRHLPISVNGYGIEYFTSYMANIYQQYFETNPNKNRHIAIMDDCLVHSKFADHLQDLTNLFQSLIDNGLKISPKKCQFFHTELVYMGLKFLIYNGRPSITPMKDKCEAIRHLDPPKTVQDCRKFVEWSTS